MVNIDGKPGRTCMVNGKMYLFFSGYAYLGMNHVPLFNEYIQQGIEKFGIIFPSSRISNSRLRLYEEFESAMKTLLSVEDSVSFSSGYLAGRTMADLLKGYNNVFMAPGTHPAISIEGAKTSGHNFSEWTELVLEEIRCSHEPCVLCCDSVNIMESNIHDFSFIDHVDRDKQLILLVDDSHGIGILGAKGEGIISRIPAHPGLEVIVTYSMSKAFGIEGGVISGPKNWCNEARKHPGYSGSTAMNPSLVYTFLQSATLYEQQRGKLKRNIAFFRREEDLSSGEGITHLPIWICDQPNAYELFHLEEMIISSFAYPLRESPVINRVVVNALHETEDVSHCYSVWKQL